MEDEPSGGRLGDYLDDNLSESERKAFEAELAADPALRAEADQLKKLEALIEAIPHEAEVPASVTARIRSALEAEARDAGEAGGPVASSPVAPARVERRSVPIFRLSRAVWAAAAVVLVAVLLWLITRPPPVAPPSKPVARLYIGKMIGRAIEDPAAEYTIYAPGLERVYHLLDIRDDRAALSYNNAKLVVETPSHTVRPDARGRLDLAGLHPDEERLVKIRRKGFLNAVGLIELAGPKAAMLPTSVLFKGTEIEVAGRVIDADTGRPIPDAIVVARDGTGFLRAGKDGAFAGSIESVTDGPPLLYAFASGYAEGRVRLDAGCLVTGKFQGDLRLEGDVRFDRTVVLVGPDGEPLEGAAVMAYAIPSEADGRDVPEYRRGRPEVGIADASGKVTLYQLLGCRYRLEIHHHNGYFASHEYDPVKPVRRIQTQPAGRGRLDLSTVRADGTTLEVGRVILSVPEAGHDHVIEASYGVGRGVEFRQLHGDTATAQVFADDAFAYSFSFALPQGEDKLDLDYEPPEAVCEIGGRLDSSAVDKVRTIRLTGELPPFNVGKVGGTPTTDHRLTAEVPVDAEGAFRFPALPRLDRVRLEGRAVGNPWRIIPLESSPSFEDVLESGRTQTVTIRINR